LSVCPKLGIDVDNQKQREEHVLLNDAIKAKNNPNYTPIVSAGGECTGRNYTYNVFVWVQHTTHTCTCIIFECIPVSTNHIS